MSDSASSVKKETHSDEGDPLIEIPNVAGNELVKRSQLTNIDIRGLVVRCTTCLHQINHNDPDKPKKHIRLGVILCSECFDFYGTSEFSQDESGNYNYCTWCGNGGKLFLCDFCPNVFCSTCIRRNIGRAAVSEMSTEGWQCYCCNPSKLKHKRAFCDLIIEFSKKSQKRKDRKNTPAVELNKNGIKNWPDALSFMSSAFESVDDSCKSFHRRVEKLKNIGMSQSKSLKHILAKFEEIVNSHRGQLNHEVKSLSRQYVSYIENQKKLEEENDKLHEKIEKSVESKDGVSKKEEEVDIKSENLSKSKSKIVAENKNPPEENGDKSIESKEDVILDESGDIEMIDLDESIPETVESKPEDSEANLNEDNYKAKLSLLNQEESSLSEIDDILAEGPSLLEDSDVENSKEKAETKIEGEPSENISKDKHASEGDTDKQTTLDDPDSDIAELFCDKSNKKEKKAVNRKLDFETLLASSSPSSSHADDSESSIFLSSGGELKVKPSRKAKKRVTKSRTRKVITTDDPKLKLRTSVVLTRCDDLLPNGETTIPLPASYILEDLDKEIKSLIKEPVKRDKKSEIVKKKSKPQAKKPKAPKIKYSGTSSSICLSSSEEEETSKKKLFKSGAEDSNNLAKKKLLSEASDESSFTETSEEESDSKKKKKSKKGKANSGSSDEFQPKKKKKFDKLLNKRILSDDDDESDFEDDKKNGEKKKQTKRKRLASDDSKSDNKKSNTDETSEEDEEDKKDKKKKKRKRIKKAAASSSSDEGKNKEKDEEGGSQNTPGKGRKNIKKVMSKKDLAMETKEAQNLERERRRRVAERQKMYNVITDTGLDGKEIITRKMVLEVDPISKEEVVQIHPDLVEKLKPHQVNGVKFMWECTIESIKELEKGEGSGAILAHCMGLGKTLQVITFLHTCLTNKLVNKYIKTAMVICPYNTVLNWSKELDYWLQEIEGDIIVHELTSAKDNYTRVDVLEYWQRDGGVLIVSYDLFRRLSVPNKIKGLKGKSKASILKCLIDPGPDIVICDEGHILKNVNSAISKACGTIRTQRRIVLTGTPLQNNLLEYHCMLSFVKPHLLGTPKEFRNRFVNPIMNGQYDDSTEYDVKRMKKRIHILHKLLEGCVQRCDYSALTKFLPPKHEFVISVKLSEIQIKMYRWYLDNMSRSKTEVKIRGGTLFADYNVLRNLCTHPFIIQTSHDRAEKRRLLRFDEEEEEEFINDESEESADNKNSSSSDADEVVRKYKTRSRNNGSGSDVEEEPLEAIKQKQWFDDFISEEDKHKIELSGKMVLLVDILKECEAIGDKVILFSQSLLTFDLIEDLLSYLDDQEVTEEDASRDIKNTWRKNIDYFRMDGSTSAEFRKQYIDYFNDPANDRARLFLVSTKAGGLGTNLVGANRVVMLDASWNPSHDVQAIFRVYRFGQKKPVYIYRFLAQGTMEEKIYDRQVTKLSLSIRVVDEQQIDRHFNAAELAELYNFEPESLPNRPTPMVPKDTLLAEMLIKHKDWIVAYHEHDSLLQNETEEDLTEEERKAAWAEYENEREGRFVSEETPLDETMKGFCREPDFNEATYEGSVIATAKSMIEAIIAAFRKQYPAFSAADLRKKLQAAIYALRSLFQEKHVQILRMKQEYVAKGSVPVSVNKYLEELNHIVTDLSMHYDNVSLLVKKDATAAFQAQMQAQAQMAQKMSQYNQNVRFAAQQNAQFGNRQFSAPNPQFARMNAANIGQRFPQFVRMNVGPNFKPGDVRWNPALSKTYADLYKRLTAQQAAQQSAQFQNMSSTSEPVITEMETNEPTPSNSKSSNNAHSTVEITEIE